MIIKEFINKNVNTLTQKMMRKNTNAAELLCAGNITAQNYLYSKKK